MRANSLNSILQNYAAVLQTLNEISESDCTEAGTKAHGALCAMLKFSFFFEASVCVQVLSPTEILSATLQSSSMSVTGQRLRLSRPLHK